MSFSVQEFLEIIMAETYVDLEKLRMAARHGIPDQVRGEVWKYLLGVETANKSDELSKRQAKHTSYRSQSQQSAQGPPQHSTETQKRVRGEVSRYLRNHRSISPTQHHNHSHGIHHNHTNGSNLTSASSLPSSNLSVANGSNSGSISSNGVGTTGIANGNNKDTLTTTLENVLNAYLRQRVDDVDSNGMTNGNGAVEEVVEYTPGLVNLCGPFVFLLSSEMEVYYCFVGLMQRIDEYFAACDLTTRLSDFLSLFRALLPDLFAHFEEEEVDFKEWAAGWFQLFLSRELPLDCALRLWDSYFSDGLEMHVYVCLAILSSLKDDLEELEQSEIHAMLLRLPNIDMDQIISQAFSVRDEVLERKLLRMH